MLGAIAGDIIGSVYEHNNVKIKDFPLFSNKSKFTDDTVMTIAVADSILNNREYIDIVKEYFRRYPYAGYGFNFKKWNKSDSKQPYYSWGNGSAMRVSPVGFAFNDLETVLIEAKKSAEITHNHPEGIKGAQATAAAIFLARTGKSKDEIKSYIESNFNYNLSQTLAEIRPVYKFDVSCQGSVPQAIICFLESTDFEDAIRNAISIGGDSDTIACITGGIAQAFYGALPEFIAEKIWEFLDESLRDLTLEFMSKYCMNSSLD
ncbi:ADP-ribosylglycohydrolase family protein [Okeania sp. SIO2B3]|uniref:ADP-ribosylglycohydrolase family protein n=1 Tax=Okeania sp. SIO2B3 TaxID=2607784 RepID=UPI0013C0284E|nr:ADP-ribosylglycohydrolase family protein [Okeania sp. SIO2B3]NET42954.1 ADP-ribosylglycohydrolase family protein [Okeania sp. SIO2B3]